MEKKAGANSLIKKACEIALGAIMCALLENKLEANRRRLWNL
jgi:hypothetical protein